MPASSSDKLISLPKIILKLFIKRRELRSDKTWAQGYKTFKV
jgi:hypothetical protein